MTRGNEGSRSEGETTTYLLRLVMHKKKSVRASGGGERERKRLVRTFQCHLFGNVGVGHHRFKFFKI